MQLAAVRKSRIALFLIAAPSASAAQLSRSKRGLLLRPLFAHRSGGSAIYADRATLLLIASNASFARP